MENSVSKCKKLREKRVLRVRNKLKLNKPRLTVRKTNKHIHAQLILDERHETLVAASTASKEFKGLKKNKESARKLGENLAKLAVAKQIEEVIFDRGYQKYHGILAAFAEGAREAGLKF